MALDLDGVQGLPWIHAAMVERWELSPHRQDLVMTCPVTGEARSSTCSMTAATDPRRLAGDSFSDAAATRRRRTR